MEKVSICLLTYMHEKYIEDALQGILSQTYQNIELVILDDGSNDRTAEKISSKMEELEARFGSITFIVHEKNSGSIPQNCNELIKNATGSFIKLIAGDDILLPTCVEELVQQMEICDDVMVVHANMFVEDDAYQFGNPCVYKLWWERNSGYENEAFFRRLMYSDRVAAPTVMIRGEAFLKYGLFDEAIAYEDYEFWLRLASKGEKFYYYDKPLVIYRRAEESITNFSQGDVEKKNSIYLESTFATKKKYIQCFQKEEQKNIWQSTYDNCKKECVRLKKQDNIELLDELFADIEIDRNIPLKMNNTTIEKIQLEASILSRWIDNVDNIRNYISNINNKKVAIYGYARLGRRFHRELEKADIKVMYIIDRQGTAIDSTVEVYTLEHELPDVDVIFVTVLNGYEEVKKQLCNVVNAKIVNLMEVIYEV